MNRNDYETACIAAGLTPMTDEELSTDYGVKYGDFTLPHYALLADTSHAEAMILAQGRYREMRPALEAQKLAAEQASRAALEAKKAMILASAKKITVIGGHEDYDQWDDSDGWKNRRDRNPARGLISTPGDGDA